MSKTSHILIALRNEQARNHILAGLQKQKNFSIAGVEKDEVGTIINSGQLKPDFLIIDLKPSEIDELELAAIIHRKTPATSIILMCEKYIDSTKAYSTGIKGILLKETDTDEIIHAIKAVSKDGLYISASYIKHFYSDISLVKQPYRFSLSLSPTERTIVMYIAKGLSDKEIAARLNYSAGTVRNILVDIKRKTRLNNRIQIVLFSLACGIISLELPDIPKTDTTH